MAGSSGIATGYGTSEFTRTRREYRKQSGVFGSQYNVQPFVGISVEAAVESVEGESREMEGKRRASDRDVQRMGMPGPRLARVHRGPGRCV